MLLLFPCSGTIQALNACLIWIRCRGVVPPLHFLYDGTYTILRLGPRPFTLQVRQQEGIIRCEPPQGVYSCE
jgi:hypothetical protein